MPLQICWMSWMSSTRVGFIDLNAHNYSSVSFLSTWNMYGHHSHTLSYFSRFLWGTLHLFRPKITCKVITYYKSMWVVLTNVELKITSYVWIQSTTAWMLYSFPFGFMDHWPFHLWPSYFSNNTSDLKGMKCKCLPFCMFLVSKNG